MVDNINNLKEFIEKTNEEKTKIIKKMEKTKKKLEKNYEILMEEKIKKCDFSEIKKCFEKNNICKFMIIRNNNATYDLDIQNSLIKKYLPNIMRDELIERYSYTYGVNIMECAYANWIEKKTSVNVCRNQKDDERSDHIGQIFDKFLRSEKRIQITSKILGKYNLNYEISDSEIHLKSEDMIKKEDLR